MKPFITKDIVPDAPSAIYLRVLTQSCHKALTLAKLQKTACMFEILSFVSILFAIDIFLKFSMQMSCKLFDDEF
jgi:hypothetical protein